MSLPAKLYTINILWAVAVIAATARYLGACR